MIYTDISRMIDHSLLNPSLTKEQLEAGCRLAIEYDTASVSIMPFYTKRCSEILRGTTVAAGTTVGFPHGANSTSVKLAEVKQALADGATELDMVSNISMVVSGQWDYVRQDIKTLTDAAHAGGAKIKVIFENCYLNEAQKIALCEICGEIGVNWVKTSTGYGTGGATLEDLKLMRKHAPAHVQVKAAGGVRDLDTLLKIREIGATRCGATRTKDILDELKKRLAK